MHMLRLFQRLWNIPRSLTADEHTYAFLLHEEEKKLKWRILQMTNKYCVFKNSRHPIFDDQVGTKRFQKLIGWIGVKLSS